MGLARDWTNLPGPLGNCFRAPLSLRRRRPPGRRRVSVAAALPPLTLQPRTTTICGDQALTRMLLLHQSSHFTSSGLSWLTRCAPWSSTILAAGRSLSARRFAWHNCAIISYLHSYYVSQVKWYHSLNIISAVRETNLPWITEIRKPADRIVSNSFVLMLCVQHALTCPSKPQLDCIPVEDMPFTYSWKQRSTELQMSLPRISCQMYVIFISACTSVWL